MDLEPLLSALAHTSSLDRRLVALTGAGCSTESGIPDYRGPETRRRARNPIQYRQFLTDPDARARYWARSMVGWPRFSDARPNPAHRALSELEALGALSGIVTQNVDRLHQAAGSKAVVELHGALADVRCLSCGRSEPRTSVQRRLTAMNAGLDGEVELAPDGDAELDAPAGFQVPCCLRCDGVLKPDVVFFGENVPAPRVASAAALVDAAAALLVVGSSLTVFSGYRFVRRAHAAGTPVILVNLGPTRADPLATLRIDASAGQVLPALAAAVRRTATDRWAG